MVICQSDYPQAINPSMLEHTKNWTVKAVGVTNLTQPSVIEFSDDVRVVPIIKNLIFLFTKHKGDYAYRDMVRSISRVMKSLLKICAMYSLLQHSGVWELSYNSAHSK
jgi:hypothetical protein